MNIYGAISSFLGTGVEFIEALTIILAVGSVRNWRSAILGGVSALVVLGILVAIIGAPLAHIIQIGWVQLVIGLLMLLFGIRWLRKAILRYAGLKKLHDEEESYQEELERQRRAGAVKPGIDSFAFGTAFSGTFLEGLEAIFIVITFGLSTHAMGSAVLGAAVATVVVAVLGILLRKPMAKIPENTMKFIVGVMLTSFGAFWVGESMRVDWPQADLSILYLAATLCVLSYLIVLRCKSALRASAAEKGRA
ncbi:MAG: TMEM165/GDT1 family protein [Alicyclobacillus sp.]|nr:TMEM165/GDT1 family protein [Alicyclobacillus sp.]